jgi:hypothetical protein
MSTSKTRPLNEWMRLRIRFSWHGKRLRQFMKDPIFDLRFKLIAMSAASWMIPILGAILASNGLLGAACAFLLYMTGATLGALVLVTLVSRFLDAHFAEFKSAKIFGVGLFALATFVAHGKAVGEINSIFPIDASVLPHATAAASVMLIATWSFWAVLIPTCIISAFCAICHYKKAQAGNATMSFAVFVATLLWASLIDHQIAPERKRQGNLYQIALEFDFNKRSKCSGLPEGAEGVAFIGPDQRRAIIAPRLVVTKVVPTSIFREVEVPPDFAITHCW